MDAAERAIFELNVTLEAIEPRIWRQIRLSNTTPLPDLHRILQVAFEWQDKHLHEFAAGGKVYGKPTAAYPDRPILGERLFVLNQLLASVGDELTYVYDFGDNWRHHVTLDARLSPEEGAFYPQCIDGGNDAPPEDTGGPYAYAAYVKDAENRSEEQTFSLDKINDILRTEFQRTSTAAKKRF